MQSTAKLLIHGGLGSEYDETLNPQTQIEFHQGLESALQAGYLILEQGGPALDAVIAAVSSLEDNPLFNAGTGSVLTQNGTIEMDAAVMEGNTRDAGAVAGLSCYKNPVQAADLVLKKTKHVLLAGTSAEDFLHQQGMPSIATEQLITPQKREAFAKSSSTTKLGTVGAVALCQQGHLAAATSTGGLMHKLPGRCSDSCIIGAGTYADEHCAISCTGDGEFFIRTNCAKDITTSVSRCSGCASAVVTPQRRSL